MDQLTTASLPSTREINRHITNLFVQCLKEAGDADRSEVTYSKLSELCGQSVQNSSIRRLLNNARKTVLNDYGYLFEVKTGVGLALLSEAEKLGTIGARHRKQIQSTATRWREQHDSIDPHKLSQPELKKLLAEELRLSIQEEMDSGSTQKRIDAAVEQSSKRLTAEDLRKAMHESNKVFANMG